MPVKIEKGHFVVILYQGKRVPAVIKGFGPFGYIAVRTSERVTMDVQSCQVRKSTTDENRVIAAALKTDPTWPL